MRCARYVRFKCNQVIHILRVSCSYADHCSSLDIKFYHGSRCLLATMLPKVYGSHCMARQQRSTPRNSNSVTDLPFPVRFYIIPNVDCMPLHFCNLHEWHCNSRKPWIAVLEPTYIMFDFRLAPMTSDSVSSGEYIVHKHRPGLLVPLHHSQDKDNGDGSHTAPYRDLHPDFVG